MSHGLQRLPWVFPKMIVNQGGIATTYNLSEYSPGYYSYVKAETVRRPRPAILSENLTVCGPHNERRLTTAPVSYVVPLGSGDFIEYHDMNPQDYVGCASFTDEPYPDWETKLRLAVKDQRTNLAQTLAEYSQAQRMFADNATTIAKTLRSLRRGDLKSVFNTLGVPRKKLRGTISNRWLELQYGWMPLLSDMHGMVEELQAALSRPRTRKLTVRAVDTVEGKISIPPPPQLRRAMIMTNDKKVVTKVVAYLRQDFSTASRLGFTNPLNLAWELLPYSFVIDWFIPIGNWLNSLDADIGFIAINGTVTTKRRFVATTDYGGQIYMEKDYVRVPFTGLPQAPLPAYKPSLGWKQVANALALLSQLKR